MSLKNVADIWLWTISCVGRFWPWPSSGKNVAKILCPRRGEVRGGKGAASGQVLLAETFSFEQIHFLLWSNIFHNFDKHTERERVQPENKSSLQSFFVENF